VSAQETISFNNQNEDPYNYHEYSIPNQKMSLTNNLYNGANFKNQKVDNDPVALKKPNIS